MHKQSIEALRKLKRNDQQRSDLSPKRDFKQNTLRSQFKAYLSKLLNLDTRQQAMKDIKGMIVQNKTTSNLRIWLSVLSESRTKNAEYEVLVVGFMVSQYKKGLLDPLDKAPSLDKTIFRVCELLSRFFKDPNPQVQMACQKSWLELYKSCLDGEPTDVKKTLLYNSLESMINGGADKMSQITAQIVVDGLLQASLVKDDLDFFRQIAKPSLVLFLKTFIPHPATITTLQTILSFFKIDSLLPLAPSITDKLIYHMSNSPVNSLGYKIKVECANALGLIGEQIQNGADLEEKVKPVLEEMATDKVWAVQVAGRKAQNVWAAKGKAWREEFEGKRERRGSGAADILGEEAQSDSVDMSYNKFPKQLPTRMNKSQPKKSDVLRKIQSEEEQQVIEQSRPLRPVTTASKQPSQYLPSQYRADLLKSSQPRPQYARTSYSKSFQDPHSHLQPPPSVQYLQRNTGTGGGYGHVQQQPPASYEPHNRRMNDLKKQIFKNQEGEFDETLAYDEEVTKAIKANKLVNKKSVVEEKEKLPDEDVLEKWEVVLLNLESDRYEQAYKLLLEMDDDIYFIRCLLKTGPVLDRLTKSTSSKVLKKMIQVMRSDFMNQLFLSMSSNSIANNVPQILQNGRNKQIVDGLDQLAKLDRYSKVAGTLRAKYEGQLRNN